MRKMLIASIASGAILLGTCAPSFAYYSKSDYTESFEIAPNQSAFLIPMQGANESTQQQFGSIEYYQANKVPIKRVKVPHAKLPNSGAFSDYYVPSAKLIVVDRTPYSREWTSSTTTGTSNKNEGIRVESKESIAVGLDVMISAHVTEQDAAKFLYNFGTKPQQTPPYDPTQQYQSDAYYSAVYSSTAQGYSLADVMDRTVHGEVQSEFARAFASGTLQYDVENKLALVDQVQKDVTKWCADRGITLDYLGYGSDLQLDPSVQKSINSVYIANKKAEAIIAMGPSLPIQKRLAEVHVIEGVAAAAPHWQLPALPQFFFLPSNIIDFISNAIGWNTKSGKLAS